MHPSILRNGLALPPPTRHQDRLAPVAAAAIGSRFEEVFQMYLFRGRQPDASHLVQPPCMRNCPREYLKKDAKSSAACIVHTAGDLASFLHGRRLWSIGYTPCLRVHGGKKEARIAAACIGALNRRGLLCRMNGQSRAYKALK
jgi:hypothetical protein